MEFDTSIRFRNLSKAVIDSDLDPDSFVHHIWDIASTKCSNIAQAGEAELWMDYSELLRTRYISCNIEKVENGYELSFKSGSKPSLFGDVLIMALALAAFWMFSKVLVPSPSITLICGTVLAIAAIVAVLIYCGKPFGNKETCELINGIQK